MPNDLTDLEELEYAEGDRLAQAGDQTALEYAWWASGFVHREAQRSDADPKSRAAFSWALNKLFERHGRWLSEGQLTDRVRIGIAFPRKMYDDLVVEFHNYYPTFSQLRAAYTRDDPEKTMADLLWAIENDAKPPEIYAHKLGGVVEGEEEKCWRNFVKWADKYCFRSGDANRGRYALASQVLDFDRKEKK